MGKSTLSKGRALNNTALNSTIKAAAAGHASASSSETARISNKVAGPATVLIGGHFAPQVRRTLLLVQAEPENSGKNLKQLLGEAINDLCEKYRKPKPYRGED